MISNVSLVINFVFIIVCFVNVFIQELTLFFLILVKWLY